MSRYIKKEWRLYLKTIILYTISRLGYLGLLYLNMIMLDNLIAGNLKGVIIYLASSLALRYVWLCVKSYNEINESRFIARLNTDVRDEICSCLADMPYTEYSKKEIGVYQSWLVGDIEKMDGLGFANLLMITHYSIDIVLGIVALVFINPFMLLTSVVSGVLSIIFSKICDSKMKDRSEEVTSSMERFVSKARECLAGLFVFRGFDCKKLFLSRMNSESKFVEEASYRYKAERTKSYAITTVFGCMMGLIQTFVMCYLIFRGWMPLHIIYGGGNILSLVGDSLGNIADCRIPLVSSKVYFDKVKELMEDREEVEKLESIENPKSIVISNLTFGYDSKQLFNDFSYDFEIGKKYAIVGPSGTGKSTLLKLLTGYIDDYTGKIEMNEVDIRRIPEDSLFKKMTYISQDTFLFNDSITNNITMGDEYSEEEIKEAVKKASLAEDIAMMEKNMDTVVGENGNLLSGGQKQRVGLARAFLHGKDILLIDEGTSALDHKNAEAVVNNLLNDVKLTVIFVSHTLSKETLNRFDEVLAI